MKKNKKNQAGLQLSLAEGKGHGRIISTPDSNECLDTTQLNKLEQSFCEWVDNTQRVDIRVSRQRILIIFLLIRYTGAKLNEVLALDPFNDIDPVRHTVLFHGSDSSTRTSQREIHISETLSNTIRQKIEDPYFCEISGSVLNVDPGFVRRKFYERAEACFFPKRLGGPEMIRKARAIELMQSNMPLPAVQMLLGHSTPNLTSSYVSFSKDEIQQVAKMFMEKESRRMTSARNTFFGKIHHIQKGDIQTQVELTTLDGFSITTIITNGSVERLALKPGKLITAEVKAPWVMLQCGDTEPLCSSENRFAGIIVKLTRSKLNTECVVQISDGIRLCAIISSAGDQYLKLNEGESVWVLFNCFSVVLHVD